MLPFGQLAYLPTHPLLAADTRPPQSSAFRVLDPYRSVQTTRPARTLSAAWIRAASTHYGFQRRMVPPYPTAITLLALGPHTPYKTLMVPLD